MGTPYIRSVGDPLHDVGESVEFLLVVQVHLE